MNQTKGLMDERLQHWKKKKEVNQQSQKPKTLQLKTKKEDKSTRPIQKENIPIKTKQIGKLQEGTKILSKESSKQNDSAEKTGLSRREKLEKWRQEKGKNKPDETSLLLSRKRSLVGYDSKLGRPKKVRSDLSQTVGPKTDAAMTAGSKDINSAREESTKDNDKMEVVELDGVGDKGNELNNQRLASFTQVTPMRKHETPRRSTTINPTSKGVLKSAMARRQMNTPRDRKTISFTPLHKSTTSSAMNNSVLRSAPQRRSISTIKCRQNQLTPFPKLSTPLHQSTASSAVKNSVLRSAPQRRSIGTTKSNQNQLTPFSKLRNLPESSVLRSAPARRSISTIRMQQIQQSTLQSARRPTGLVLSGKPRRRTIATVSNEGLPNGVEPFAPRGEWQNENLSIRERLDIWLSVRGKTVTKPYVIIKQTPRSKKQASKSPTTADDVEDELNRTFSLDGSIEETTDKETSQKFPKMSDIERKIIEASLKDILVRIQQDAEQEQLKEELDLILSTSPGVVMLSQYWIARARLAATNESVERVICLLEQANAFDAEPQDMIRDEICQYLEKLKAENECAHEKISGINFANEDAAKPSRTPAKRVKFMDTQRHLAFNSSLIKFCLLESTPFRRRLKSTLAKQILTPVRRSGRIERVESRLPSVVRSHVQTVSSPSELSSDVKDGEIFFLPNLNVDSKWNEIWEEKEDDIECGVHHELSF